MSAIILAWKNLGRILGFGVIAIARKIINSWIVDCLALQLITFMIYVIYGAICGKIVCLAAICAAGWSASVEGAATGSKYSQTGALMVACSWANAHVLVFFQQARLNALYIYTAKLSYTDDMDENVHKSLAFPVSSATMHINFINGIKIQCLYRTNFQLLFTFQDNIWLNSLCRHKAINLYHLPFFFIQNSPKPGSISIGR